MSRELRIVPPPAPQVPPALTTRPDYAVPREPPIRSYVLRGQIVLAFLFGGFGLWATLAPLTSAAIAPGVVKVDSYRKTVQHLEGGIVSEILVREGEFVKKGQVLVRLDASDAAAGFDAVRGQIGALEAETATIKQQLPSAEEELRDQQTLYNKGYSRKPQLFELERSVAKMKGDIAANENRLLSLREEALKAKNKLERTAITAPQDGTVMDLRIHTLGGVIPPGATILDIVPTRDKLVVEVKIRPTDIDVVRSGLKAAVRFIAYKQWMTPVVQGMVTRVSADAVTEERTGAAYFLATVEVNSNELSRVPRVKLQPGMPVEAAIITGRRTMLAFLFQPITDSFAHAFRED